MADYPKGHVVSKVKIGDQTKALCITCGNEGLGRDGKLPAKITEAQAANALIHRLKHGRCKDCFSRKK